MKPISGYIEYEAAPPTFDQWWEVWPKKTGNKVRIEAKFDALSEKDKSACYLGTIRHKETNPQWTDRQFICGPEVFINGRRWGDEIIITRKEEAAETAQVGDNADKVWSFMIEFYGERWVKEHGSKPSDLWKKFLKPMSEKRIKRGMRQVLDRNVEFLPSLPAFIGYCSPTFGEQHPNKALPRPAGDPEKAAQAFKAMKEILGV